MPPTPGLFSMRAVRKTIEVLFYPRNARQSWPDLPNAELVTYPRLGHTLRPVLDDVLDRVRAFIAALPAAERR